RSARGLGAARSKRNDVPVVILLRSRIDSVMCRQGALQKAHGSLLARPRKRLCFGHFRRKDRFPSRLESYLLAFAHFAPLRRANHHGGESDDTPECQGQPPRYNPTICGKVGVPSLTPQKRGGGDPPPSPEPYHQNHQKKRA